MHSSLRILATRLCFERPISGQHVYQFDGQVFGGSSPRFRRGRSDFLFQWFAVIQEVANHVDCRRRYLARSLQLFARTIHALFFDAGRRSCFFFRRGKQLTADADNVTALLCVIFFVFHGSELDLRQFVHAGLIGSVYILCRVIGKYLGVFSASKVVGEAEDVRRWLGLALLAQAGAAIALCTIAVQHDPVLGKQLQTIILGSVVFFEIAGPLSIRYSVLQAGEIPIEQAIYHLGHTPLEQAKELWVSRDECVWRRPPVCAFARST